MSFLRKQTGHLKTRWFNYGLETIVVIIGILVALAVDNWNNDRKDRYIEQSILTEISKGLREDLKDIRHNINGHNTGLEACVYFRNIINNEQVRAESVGYYYHYLTRDFFTIFNTSGYESLKSRGLELIRNDSVRIRIISTYEQDYSNLKKMEEEYFEMQYQKNYFNNINILVSPNLIFNNGGEIVSVLLPLNLNENNEKLFLSYLWKIKRNRDFLLKHYTQTEQKIEQLILDIEDITK